MLSDHNGIKSEIRDKRKVGSPKIFGVNNTLLK